MNKKLLIARRLLSSLGLIALGAMLVVVIGYSLYLRQAPNPRAWHLEQLDQEFTAESGINDLAAYLALEERLFQQLDERIYANEPGAQVFDLKRYHRGSLSDPERWQRNWNRTFEFVHPSPAVGVVLLHGMSDSPYSLRALAERLHASGAHVLGLRMPGHGTIPSGLVELEAEDLLAATRLAVDHMARELGDRPIQLVGYSTGAALAVLYALDALQDPTLPTVDGLVLLSPAIGVSSAAAFASWQARAGHLLGIEQLAWTAMLPEYDPYKYNSFAVNAGDVVYRLTQSITERMARLAAKDALTNFPPILAFASIVDATVSTPALVENLFTPLPEGRHELVLFDINRVAVAEPLLTSKPHAVVQTLRARPEREFTLSVISNRDPQSLGVVVRSQQPGGRVMTEPLGLSWPRNVYSLSHVAVPFPPTDPLYGGKPDPGAPLQLGNLALRGEHGALRVSGADMLRLRWNPFYAYLERRALEWILPGGAIGDSPTTSW
jgi:alpha-beta hydrolase superfamily lysophospholipase